MSNKEIKEMSSFFDEVADGYDNHMKKTITLFDEYYSAVSSQVKNSKDSINVLDLGCGTGTELKGIFDKAPNANITAVDLSPAMLEKLKDKYMDKSENIRLVNASYEGLEFAKGSFDYVVSVMSLHHYKHDRKLMLYRKIFSVLKKGGIFINGDYVVSPQGEKECIEEYDRIILDKDINEDGTYHIDIPFSITTEIGLLKEAGFENIDVLYRRENAAVFTAYRL